MGPAAWLELIKGILAFPDAMLKIVRLMKGTPEAHREALVSAIQVQADHFAKTGRPTWG